MVIGVPRVTLVLSDFTRRTPTSVAPPMLPSSVFLSRLESVESTLAELKVILTLSTVLVPSDKIQSCKWMVTSTGRDFCPLFNTVLATSPRLIVWSSSPGAIEQGASITSPLNVILPEPWLGSSASALKATPDNSAVATTERSVF